MIKAWFAALAARPLTTALVAGMTCIVLGSDYFSRLHTPVADGSGQQLAAPQLPPAASAQQLTEPMQQWLAQLAAAEEAAARAAAGNGASEAESRQSQRLAGATELDDLQLVVRATFISPTLNQRLALLELQQPDGSRAIITAREQDTFGRFQLTQIGVHQLRFTDPAQPDSAAIMAPVFAGAATLQQGSNDVSDN